MMPLLVIAGFGFSCISAWLIYRGLSIETVVPSIAGEGLPAGMDGIANLSLMHAQSTILNLGIGAGIVGAGFLIGAAIAHLLEVRQRDE